MSYLSQALKLQRIKRGIGKSGVPSGSPTPTPTGAPMVPVDELLDTPQANLKAPLLIESERLGGERLYLVATEAQGKEIEKAGGVCYLPGEVRAIMTLSAGMDEDSLKDYLKKLHAVKRTFRGARIQ